MKTVLKLYKRTSILFLVLITLLVASDAIAQRSGDFFYYYPPLGKIHLDISKEKILVKFRPDVNQYQQLATISKQRGLKEVKDEMYFEPLDVYVLDLQEGSNAADVARLLASIRSSVEVEYASPFMTSQNEVMLAPINRILVGLKQPTDLEYLQSQANFYHLNIVRQNEFDTDLYHLALTDKSPGDALDMANRLYETGIFAFAEPDFLLLNLISSTNDPLVNSQWSLNNTGSNSTPTGTADADMDVFEAWATTTGSSNIKIAIIDSGVDLLHPDLASNLVAGFGASGNGSAGNAVGFGDAPHGTACAGIVAAVGNNSVGVAGVAYSCKIIPVQVFVGTMTTSAWLTDGLNWAWQNGADVLSNSWGGGSSFAAIDNAISDAVSSGRSGKGSVVLFSSGNDNSDVASPAFNPLTIAVGAMSMCDERKNPASCDGETWWGGNFGTNLDVSAPGVKIQTTDISGANGYNTGDYTPTFNGTSSACPNAAGVVALMLSIDSNLTVKQVRTILESTCDKTGGYTYNNNVVGQPNGSWSAELGHGRVNAASAVAGVLDPDFDMDGFTVAQGDCNNFDATINPGAPEICDFQDNNCNGTIDEGLDTDNDGFTPCGGDCNDSDSTINPNAIEVCDSIDNNCDGIVDFPLVATYASTDVPISITTCCKDTFTSTLTISGVTGNIIDLNIKDLLLHHTYLVNLRTTLTSPSGDTLTLFDEPPCGDDHMLVTFDDAATLTAAYFNSTCNPTNGVFPPPPFAISGTFQPIDMLSTLNGTSPNGVWTLTIYDRDGDDIGSIEGWGLEIMTPGTPIAYYADTDGDSFGDPSGSTAMWTCAPEPSFGYVADSSDCDDTDPNIHPGATEVCDGIDNNCDGNIDECDVCSPTGHILYVNDDATGLNNGSSWADAFTDLQSAFASTCPVSTQIWVAAGTYQPTANADRHVSFQLRNEFAVYGGFTGNEAPNYDLSLRDLSSNTSILSGEIGGGSVNDNSFTVVNGSNTDNSAILDGFTITLGQSDGGGDANSNGGGMYISEGTPTISNCAFVDNTTTNRGGAMYITASSKPIVINCSFNGNTANIGGGIYNFDSSNLILTNCSFSGNSANSGGGIFNFTMSSIILTNCSFAGNNANSGISIYNRNFSNSQLINCIIWEGNNSSIENNNGSSVSISYSIVEGGYSPCTNCPSGNGFIDPLFVGPNDLRLRACTPAIDIGSDIANVTITDLDGNTRKFDALAGGQLIDLGAYELQIDMSKPTIWTGLGNGTLWSDPNNWSDEQLPQPCRDVLIPSGTVKVPANFNADGKTLEVVTGALLEVKSPGTIDIKNN